MLFWVTAQDIYILSWLKLLQSIINWTLFMAYRYLPLLWTHLDLDLLQEVMILRYSTQIHNYALFALYSSILLRLHYIYSQQICNGLWYVLNLFIIRKKQYEYKCSCISPVIKAAFHRVRLSQAQQGLLSLLILQSSFSLLWLMMQSYLLRFNIS